MKTENNHRNLLHKLIAICILLLLFISVINVMRALDDDSSDTPTTKYIVKETSSKRTTVRAQEKLANSIRSKDALKSRGSPDGFQLFRYYWVGNATVYVAEMERDIDNLKFDVELANNQIIGRETVTGTTRRLKKKGLLPLAGVNGSFGIRSDGYGRGGMIFNLHIQGGELVSVPILLDRWGYSPPSAWGETSFGVTPDGEFLLDSVKLNGKIHIDNWTLAINAVNQICDSYSPIVLYTSRFGRSTLTRRCYEFVLKELTLPITGKYNSQFVVAAVNPRGNSRIPTDGVVIAIEPSLGSRWYKKITQNSTGSLEIALTPNKWQTVQNAIGGNLRLLRNGIVEPELSDFARSGGRSAYRHDNGASRHPRSALGFNDNKLFLIVVDGRQPGHSMGMTLYDMATFLKDIGVKTRNQL